MIKREIQKAVLMKNPCGTKEKPARHAKMTASLTQSFLFFALLKLSPSIFPNFGKMMIVPKYENIKMKNIILTVSTA